MNAAVESTSAQWAAYDLATAKAYRAHAETCRLHAAAALARPFAENTAAELAASYTASAESYDRLAGELEAGAQP